jgi:cation diffusion facilitator CzcD-associated flavoprotein CzcO
MVTALPVLHKTPGIKTVGGEDLAQTIPTVAGDFRPDPNGIPEDDMVHENKWYNQDFDGFRLVEQVLYTKRPIRLICVGAGAVGLTVAFKAERELENVLVQIYEKNHDVGGTWLENRYPGCMCDIPSHSYQFTWARNSRWTSFYSKAEEIWQYFKDTAVKYGLEKYIKFEHKVECATWNEENGVWDLEIRTPDGSLIRDSCEVLVNGTGILNSWSLPNIPGVHDYEGKLMHSAHWDQSFDLTDKTVAVIGGGFSAVQVIPNIQPIVKKLIPFLRSPVWVTTGFGAQYAGPNGTNFSYSEEQKKKFETDPEGFDQYVRGLEGELNKRFTLMHNHSKDQKISRDYVAEQMRKSLSNEELAARMVPNFGLGCRRMTPGEGYLQSLSKPNVHVVHDSVVRFTKTGVIDAAGTEHHVDAVVCATGFADLFKPHFKVVGRGGKIVQDEFGDQPIAYMSIMAEHFPNMFREYPSLPLKVTVSKIRLTCGII